MNTKDFLRLGVSLGAATRLATDFISKFIPCGDTSARDQIARDSFQIRAAGQGHCQIQFLTQ